MKRLARSFGPQYNFVSDAQEIESILGRRSKWRSLFVLVGDGEYLEVWGSVNAIPWINLEYKRVKI